MLTEGEPDLQALSDSTKESIEKARDLLDGMKIVQEHENAILGDEGRAPK